MTSLVSVVVAALLTAGPPSGVVLGKRSGVNRALALSRADLVRESLGPPAGPGPIEDLTSCANRLPCLVKAARGHGWSSMVVVETASILNDAIVDVRLLSIDDDGKELARANAQTPDSGLRAALPEKLAALKHALEQLAGPLEPVKPVEPVVTRPVEPLPATQPPPPTPPELVANGASSKPAARWVPLGVSLGVLAAGGICFGVGSDHARRLGTETFTSTEVIDSLVSSGKLTQRLGVAGLVAGGVLSVGSVVLALLWPDAKVAPAVTWLPGGGAFALAGVWP